MAGLPMPDEGQLPPGPLRELTAAIHALYQSAGMPGTHRISDEIKKRNDLNDTVSHEAVRRILMGEHARWSKVECLVMQLSRWSVISSRSKRRSGKNPQALDYRRRRRSGHGKTE